MNVTTRFEVYTRTEKRKATIQRVFAIATLGLLVLSLAIFAMPVSVLGAEPADPVGDPASGTSPLDGPEFWVAKYGTAAQASGTSPLDGPEFWMAKYGTAAQASGTSPLDGPEFWVVKYGAEPASCTVC
jgi:hypothetical protein